MMDSQIKVKVNSAKEFHLQAKKARAPFWKRILGSGYESRDCTGRRKRVGRGLIRPVST